MKVMGKMKTWFDLDFNDAFPDHQIILNIVGRVPKDEPYLGVIVRSDKTGTVSYSWLPDKDLERFAVNILKAIGSKKLK